MKVWQQLILVWGMLAGSFSAAQWQVGAYGSDFGGDPDEAAHAVTAVMVHDYVAHGLARSPIRFAEDYYQSWPKVALGHYPPAYYVAGASALAIWCDPRALLILQALLAGAVGTLVFFALRMRAHHWLVRVLAAAVATFLPEMIRSGSHVMADLQVTLLMLTSALLWWRFMIGPSTGRGILFGLVAALAILTKASAVALGALPVFSLVLTRRFQLLRKAGWWLSALPVLVLSGPWMVFSTRYTEEGLVNEPPLQFFQQAIIYYGEAIPRVFGWGTVTLLAIVAVVDFMRVVRGKFVDEWRSCLWSMVVSTQILMMCVPTGFSPRYLLPWWPAAILLIIDAVASLAVFRLKNAGWMRRVVPVAALAVIWIGFGPIKEKRVEGFAESVMRLLDSGPVEGGVWMVSSDPRGEGAVIAAAAFAWPERWKNGLRVLRGSKELARGDWLGRNYDLRYQTPDQIRNRLDALELSWVFVDLSMPSETVKPHEMALRESLSAEGSGWKLMWRQPIRRGVDATGEMLVFKHAR
jgi:4-amino-4-deoxy-L-arabinose transferase-like glycosyltransferase